jgi:glycosyltransferase involved in cell wall biosynthesis
MTMLVGELKTSGAARSIVRVRGWGHAADPVLLGHLRQDADHFAFMGASALQDPRLLRALGSAIRRHGVDVIHSHLNMANAASRVAGALLRVPHVSTIHAEPTIASEDSARRIWADGLTARLSTAGRRRLAADGRPVRAQVPRPQRATAGHPQRCHSPAARCRLRRARKRAELVGPLGADARIVLCAARLDEAKGIGELISAADVLRHRLPALRVLIAGRAHTNSGSATGSRPPG